MDNTNPMERFHTRTKIQEPIRQFLVDPATGALTSDYIDVRSSLSDEFMAARDRSMQEVSEIEEKDEVKRKAIVKDLQLRMTASLVAGWSFSQPCTEENVVAFLHDAPQIRLLVNGVADDAQRFFNRPSAGSSASPKQK